MIRIELIDQVFELAADHSASGLHTRFASSLQQSFDGIQINLFGNQLALEAWQPRDGRCAPGRHVDQPIKRSVSFDGVVAGVAKRQVE